MFETTFQLKTSDFARFGEHREKEYIKCWSGLPKLFDAENPDAGFHPKK